MNKQRKYAREKYSFSVDLISENFTENCQLIDISVGGCKVRASHKIDKGIPVKLIIKKFGQLEGKIIWNSHRNMGIRFSDDPNSVGELLIALATYGPA
ncbi:MAG: PilZ domain-containing protein [gamma proteobacterium symbiont of Taylorina sp.]|nr:PilZ domain-containing protein [gamma proteobacterium symbiont of Taylorina sp.]